MIDELKAYINGHKIIKVILSALAMLGGITLMVFAVFEKMETGVKAFRVDIEYADDSKVLINEDYVLNEVRKLLGYDLTRAKIKDIELGKVEQMLLEDAFVDSAEVYINSNHVVVAKVVQKNPIARIQTGKEDFYLDIRGNYLPLSKVAAVRVPVMTGHIQAFEKDYMKQEAHQYKDLYTLAKAIEEDNFLRALVEQVHVERNKEFLLIPKIGKEKIMMGDVYDLNNKIFNLKQFYKEGLTRVGWGMYSVLDLRYQDLVYAQK